MESRIFNMNSIVIVIKYNIWCAFRKFVDLEKEYNNIRLSVK
jgi:hypothetical protein